MFESSLRVKLSLASIDEGAGAKSCSLDPAQWTCASFVRNSSTQLNRYKKLLRWKNFATHPFTALVSSGYFLPDFMKVVLIDRSNHAEEVQHSFKAVLSQSGAQGVAHQAQEQKKEVGARDFNYSKRSLFSMADCQG
jgi:hypothetical protein